MGTSGYHSDHQPGTWTWDHMNETIQWFDWHDGEPNNFGHNENCLALREYHDPFFPIFRDYFWNDMNCDSAHTTSVRADVPSFDLTLKIFVTKNAHNKYS